MLHGVADIDILHPPAVSLELVDDDPAEVLFIDGVVRAEGGGVVVEDDRLVLMVLVVGAKIRNERGDFALELGVERFDYVEPLADGLPCDYPVDIGVVVHADTDRRGGDDICVLGSSVERLLCCGRVGCEFRPHLIEVGEVGSVVEMGFAHGGVEAVLGNADTLAEDGGLKSEGREVAFHLFDVGLAEELEVLDGGVFLVIDSDRAHLVELAVKVAEVLAEIVRRRVAGFAVGLDTLFDTPNLADRGFDGGDEFPIHLVLVVQEPRAFLGLRHIGQDKDRMVERVLAEIRLDTAVGGESLVFEAFIVNELGFVYQEPREGE